MAIVITSSVEGRRRAGVAHAARPVAYDDDYFSAEQLEALQSDPVLTVAQVEGPAADAAIAPSSPVDHELLQTQLDALQALRDADDEHMRELQQVNAELSAKLAESDALLQSERALMAQLTAANSQLASDLDAAKKAGRKKPADLTPVDPNPTTDPVSE